MKKEIIVALFLCLSVTITSQVNPINKNSDNYKELIGYSNTLKIIDAHEHMISPEEHSKKYLSFWDFLFSYVKWDMASAGMPRKYMGYYPKNDSDAIVLFNEIEPYMEAVQYGSFMHSVNVTLQRFYGFEKITRDNFIEIGHKLNKNNSKEDYIKTLRAANIVKMIVQSDVNYADSMFLNVTPSGFQYKMKEKIKKMCKENASITLKDVMEVYDQEIKMEKERGSKSIKFFSPAVFIEPYDTIKAKEQFELFKIGQDFGDRSALSRFIYEEQIKITAKYKMIVNIHLGVWMDITDKSPSILFPIVEKHPEATFEIYHMGIPYIRETAFLGKNYPNVYLNMCWASATSESMFLNSLDEWIDLVPTNKIIAFGGDLRTLPIHVVGELEVVKQNLCLVLSNRIKRGRMDMEGAKKILKAWFYDNPARLYGI